MSVSYKLLATGGVLRLPDNACIPPTTDNVDWLAYLAWLALGNTPLPADPVLPPDDAGAFDERQRTQKIEDLERRLSLGAPQGDINNAILDLLKE